MITFYGFRRVAQFVTLHFASGCKRRVWERVVGVRIGSWFIGAISGCADSAVVPYECECSMLRYALKEIADIALCADEPDLCFPDSGPRCGRHIYDEFIVEQARKALGRAT